MQRPDRMNPLAGRRHVEGRVPLHLGPALRDDLRAGVEPDAFRAVDVVSPNSEFFQPPNEW